jgi:protein tyrosine phosphatase (PTP) superfamily phosphohydrolase (DUF442 family)
MNTKLPTIDISKVTDTLYVGSKIGKENVDELKVLKFDLIISMIGQIAPDEVYNLPPFKTLWIRTYDTFFTPISMKKLLTGVEAAGPVIQNKGKVLVFCMLGRRRSIIMSAAILISTGLTGEQAVELLIASRKVADPRRWYVRWQIRKFEKFWHEKQMQAGLTKGVEPHAFPR